MRLGVKAALVQGQRVAGDVDIHNGAITTVGIPNPSGKGLAVPGLIDVQINGFAGIDFTDATTADYNLVAEKLAATGVTSFQPTLIALPIETYQSTLANFHPDQVEGARVLGMHLEGPFISPDRCGAHDPNHMLEPDIAAAAQLLASGKVTHMTIAPELDGASELISFVSQAGVTVSLGHTDATAADAHAGFDAGATSVTHIFNAQRPFSHREPALGVTALTRPDAFVTAIVDGIHLADETVRLIANAAGKKFVLITDAIAATGQPDTAPVPPSEGPRARQPDGFQQPRLGGCSHATATSASDHCRGQHRQDQGHPRRERHRRLCGQRQARRPARRLRCRQRELTQHPGFARPAGDGEAAAAAERSS